eukprot:3410423-Pyramimonas_sp.AAC.1
MMGRSPAAPSLSLFLSGRQQDAWRQTAGAPPQQCKSLDTASRCSFQTRATESSDPDRHCAVPGLLPVAVDSSSSA